MIVLDILPGTTLYGFSLNELKPIEAVIQTIKIENISSENDYCFEYYDKDGKFITSQGYYDKSFKKNAEKWFTSKYIRDYWLSEEINNIKTVITAE